MKVTIIFLFLVISPGISAQAGKESAITEKNISQNWVFEKVVNASKTKEEIAEMNDLMEGVTFLLRKTRPLFWTL